MDEKLIDNQKTWNIVANDFFEASALPEWGPFGVGEDKDFFSGIQGKVFLEVGCGSGRSIKYLIEHGANKVYGIDISKVQLDEAKRYNQEAVNEGNIELFQVPMEQKITLAPVDAVFSVYALGWTQDPQTTLANIHSYLKQGGLFVWSWDHAFFSDVQFKDGNFVVVHNYHDEKPLVIKDWKREGTLAHLTYRKSSTWFQLLTAAGFEVVAYHEPAPINMRRGYEGTGKYYSIEKALKVPATFIFVCRKK